MPYRTYDINCTRKRTQEGDIYNVGLRLAKEDCADLEFLRGTV